MTAPILDIVAPGVRRLLAPNPGPFTQAGTNSFVLGRGRVAVVDPGPELPGHIEALLAALDGETVEAILVTHTHLDHSPGAALLQARTGAPTHGFGPHGTPGGPDDAGADHGFVPDRRLADGEVLEAGGLGIEAVHTPGHASNHLAFALPRYGVLLSGDHVMGWSTSIVSPPDGDMAAYMRSLDKLAAREDRLYLPAHGPAIEAPLARVAELAAHRRGRRAAILRGLAAGDRLVPQLVDRIYLGLDPRLKPAAGRSVLAHLIELIDAGAVAADGPATVAASYRPA